MWKSRRAGLVKGKPKIHHGDTEAWRKYERIRIEMARSEFTVVRVI
jgi:hypothetical protein